MPERHFLFFFPSTLVSSDITVAISSLSASSIVVCRIASAFRN
ncbi:hypothetical protein CPter91_1862 [Collimonas pratensis]|uniref:Uncharacterized protein n=1 Tax=Collimonas pratensis TaxID=279113 RepID=A0A127Q337_9BURK|nr:hypothetical protein CPter91_1862 [Collimonas pratensis]